MMTGEGEQPVLFGASYSVYTRIARLSLEEKGVAYRLEETDVFAPGRPSPDYLVRHPFGRIPAFEWQGFRLYEASAIARYVDEIFPGPSLQPADARTRARMNQVISILDSYCYRTFVWDIFVERVRAPATGRMPDEKKIATALPSGGGLPQCPDHDHGLRSVACGDGAQSRGPACRADADLFRNDRTGGRQAVVAISDIAELARNDDAESLGPGDPLAAGSIAAMAIC